MDETGDDLPHGAPTSAPSSATDARRLLARRAGRKHHPSPASWSDEVLYMLLPDRFSDGREKQDGRPLLKGRASVQLSDAERLGWSTSGSSRFQGGTLAGVVSKLDYLADLGVTAIWLGPPWKQRLWSDDYHGYAVQHFFDVDPRFGTRQDLVDLVREAHGKGIRVILDVIVNHTAANWAYASGGPEPAFTATPGFLPPYRTWEVGGWYDGTGGLMPPGSPLTSSDDGVWPRGPLQDPAAYHRAGRGSYGVGDLASAFSELRVSDFFNRDLALTDGPLRGAVLQTMIEVWAFWMELTDCDGFRIDTFKHIRVEEGRVFCGAIRERAERLGKENFLLVAEVAGGDDLSEGYLTVDAGCLSAALEIGDLKTALRQVAGGDRPPSDFLGAWTTPAPTTPSDTSESVPLPGQAWVPGSHRNLGPAFVYCVDDHDNVSQYQQRFASLYPDRSVPALALLTWTLGVPCVYFGLEQELALDGRLTPELWYGPFENLDRYLRESMFGPAHPRRSGRAGLPGPSSLDTDVPGFGPCGTSGQHVFDQDYPLYRQTRAMLAIRRRLIPLRRGRQYQREVRLPGQDFLLPDKGEVAAWSRILADQEVVCVVNLSTTEARTVDVRVDASLTTGPTTRVLLRTDQLEAAAATVPLGDAPDGTRYVSGLVVPPVTAMVLG